MKTAGDAKIRTFTMSFILVRLKVARVFWLEILALKKRQA